MNRTAFHSADILLPKSSVNMEKWAVIACDQYTGNPGYWDDVYRIVGESPSTLNLILPEIFLEKSDVGEKIENIHKTMNKYLSDGIFREYKNAMIYVERVQQNGVLRKGIIGAIDLQQYDFSRGSTSPVRATEATIVERIPPRVKIRQDAVLELPHIMILIDDPDDTIMNNIHKESLEKLYDTDLMKNGGHVSGYLLSEDVQEKIDESLVRLSDSENFGKKYGAEGTPVLLFAMGDGNHSLATAKQYYEQLKKDNPGQDLSHHPARYALAEIVNLHSDALDFEPIYRVVYGVDCGKLVSEMAEELELSETEKSEQFFELYSGGQSKKYYIHRTSSNLSVGSVQNFLDVYLQKNGGKIDYIHGKKDVVELADRLSGMAFVLPEMHKSELFPTVIKDGALPRKTFSMGHADDKRFYIEAKRI